ncbi:MAG: leucyl aminopeptidase [Deltaproteobacteria bacterium]
MKFVSSSKRHKPSSVDMTVYFLARKRNRVTDYPEGEHGRLLQSVVALGDFKGKEQEAIVLFDMPKAGDKAGRILYLGRGTQKGGRELYRKLGGIIAKSTSQHKAARVEIVLPSDTDQQEAAECLCEGIILGSYLFGKYRAVEDPDELPQPISRCWFVSDSGAGLNKAIERGCNSAHSCTIARDLANEPGNKLSPSLFARQAADLARNHGLHSKILKLKDLQRLGMGGLLGVGQGSIDPPHLIIQQYIVHRDAPTVMLVGKGLTFDSGGISLKPSAGMENMKYDMCGGGAVLGAMAAIGREKPANCNVAALVPVAENLPGSSALKPGDIVTIYGGKTVEVVNTDAEGRLVLADALAYGVEQFKPKAVVDVATLTGAMVVALGHHITGLFSNDRRLARKIEQAGKITGEPLWRMPLGEEYRKQLKSEIADLSNVSKGRDGGSITAAAFLQEFVKKTAWAHLDIAGTAWNFTEKSYIPKGPSGIAARTLLELIRSWK